MPKSNSPQQENMLSSIFSLRLRAEMSRSSLNQQQLAAAVGCTQSDISRYKAGRIPSGDKLIALAAALGCTAESLFEDEDLSGRIREEPPAPVGIDWKKRALVAERKLAKLRSILEEPETSE